MIMGSPVLRMNVFIATMGVVFAFFLFPVATSFCADSVELNGDTVEYATDGNKVTAQGNVDIRYKDAVMTCDRVEFYQGNKVAHAYGNVRVVMPQGEIRGESITFNFDTMEGDLTDARIESYPYYGYGRTVSKLRDGRLVIINGWISTSDYDDPRYRIEARKIEIIPGDKMTARNVRIVLGKVPVMMSPKYSQSLKDKKPRVILRPGYDKDWGLFLLQDWRYYLGENLRGTVHVDYRERKDFASGVDMEYKTPSVGSGMFRTYYMNERNITSKRIYEERPSPTIERERFKAEWRHRWQIDQQTDAIMQYYRLSDATFLKDYFRREYDKDSSPDTYAVVTHVLPHATTSLRVDKRVNRFESAVERLPEVRFDMPNLEIVESGVYFKNTTLYSNLSNKTVSPSEVRTETMRVHTDNQLSYPLKVGIIEAQPYVGMEETYYSKTKYSDRYDVVRGLFKTGVTLSTKFYRIFDAECDAYGVTFNGLRHVITPSVAYGYMTNPTIASTALDSFDSIDARTRDHTITFGIENKLQTKREKATVDLLRALVSTDFRLKEYPGGGGFDLIRSDFDIRPADWMVLAFDSAYDTRGEHLDSANFDWYINGGSTWSLGIGKRYNREVDDQITTNFNYRLSPKWMLRTFERFDVSTGKMKEQEYALTRDLHSWILEMIFNHTRGEGSEILFMFTLKAFPDMGFDVGTSFNRRKSGSQTGGE